MPVFGESLGERHIVQETNPEDIRYAWFSRKMCLADNGEVALYEMEDGTVKEVTNISASHEHGCGWGDMQFLGKTTTSGYRGRTLTSLVPLLVPLLKSELIFSVPKPTSGEVLTE